MAELRGNIRNVTQKMTGRIDGIRGAKGDKGDTGEQGVSIVSTRLNPDYTLTITLSDGTSYTSPSIRGEKGDTGEQGVKGDKGDKGDKGEQGIQGEPGDDYILTPSDKAEIAGLVDNIDDTAGAGDADKTWSADKITHELESAGSVKDVTVNGTSIVDSESGVAEIPIGANGILGLLRTRVGDNGLQTLGNGYIGVYGATDNDIKNGIQSTRPITSNRLHNAAFYGLAKAAGADMKNSSNAVGTYTEEAKVAIRNMIDATGESASVTVTGTDPVIQATRNTRYICGEILSLDFTPCSSGICEVIFTSGSSVTVLTLPETIKMPEWFEVETNHTYEISVVDGVYGAVMVW